ncbi:MAG: hypothetical protein OXI55_04840 [Gammaproteobacteria bacterium]|nr:hypothetical protein [Gammaproteobacteria bacterium]
MKNRNRIAAGALVVAGLASTAFAGAPEADAFAPAAELGYAVAAAATDNGYVQNALAAAGAGGGPLVAAWLGAKIGGKFGAVLGGPVGVVVGAGIGGL